MTRLPTLLHPPRPRQVAQARRIVADPARCADKPGLRRMCWLVLVSAQGRTPRQRAPQPPTGGSAA